MVSKEKVKRGEYLTLRDLAEACNKPANHKEFRKWHCP